MEQNQNMKGNVVGKRMLMVSCVSFLLMSLSFLLMPIDNYNANIKTSNLNIVTGLCFWGFLIVGCVCQVLLSRQRKQWSRSGDRNMQMIENTKVGVIGFLKNRPAMIADITLFLSLAGFVLSMVFTNMTGYICYVFLTIFVFSFCMHCILNGKNYYYLTSQRRMRQARKKEKQKKERQNGGEDDHGLEVSE